MLFRVTLALVFWMISPGGLQDGLVARLALVTSSNALA